MKERTMKNEKITIELDAHEAWVMTEVLSRFKSKDTDLIDTAYALYTLVLNAREKAGLTV